jgi:hypothetical protein
MQWALDHWEEAAPAFLQRLEAYADGTDRSDETLAPLFLIVHLLGDKGEKRAFPALCKLMRDQVALDDALGIDCSNESFLGVLIKCFDGDLAPLQAVIEDAGVDEIDRSNAMRVLTYLSRTGHFPREAMHAYLLHLRATLQPQAPHWVWGEWATAVAIMTFDDLVPQAEQLFKAGLVPDELMDLAHFHQDLRTVRADPTNPSPLPHSHIGPFDDAIGTLASWSGFSSKRDEPDESLPMTSDLRQHSAMDRLNSASALFEPRINPLRHVGRNDPCPCGSGKKYKKCCLVAA